MCPHPTTDSANIYLYLNIDIVALFRQIASAPMFATEKLAMFPVCTHPATLYAATDAFKGGTLSKLPVVQSGDWRLYVVATRTLC